MEDRWSRIRSSSTLTLSAVKCTIRSSDPVLLCLFRENTSIYSPDRCKFILISFRHMRLMFPLHHLFLRTMGPTWNILKLHSRLIYRGFPRHWEDGSKTKMLHYGEFSENFSGPVSLQMNINLLPWSHPTDVIQKRTMCFKDSNLCLLDDCLLDIDYNINKFDRF